MCSMKTAECPIYHLMENEHAAAHASACQNLYSHTPQSLDYPTCAESVQMTKLHISIQIVQTTNKVFN